MLYTISKIRKEDIVIIRVIRPYSCNSRADTEDTQNTHVSELEYMNIPYDIILINNGSIDNYIEKFDKIISI
jgi:hypothetical protein